MTPEWETRQFGEFLVDREHRILRQGASAVPVTAKVFDTLVYLITRPGELVLRKELLDAVWPGVNVEEATLSRTISDLRKALGDGTGGVKFIETVPKFGYRFVAQLMPEPEKEVEVEPIAAPVEPIPVVPMTRLRRWRSVLVAVVLLLAGVGAWMNASSQQEMHSLAVLPFHLVGGERDEVLEIGIADTLIASLSRIKSLQVRSLGAVRRFAGGAQDPVAAGRELRTDAVLEGTIQRMGDRVRVTLRLLSTRDGSARWSSHFDEAAGNALALEDSIALRATTELAAETKSALEPTALRLADPEIYRIFLEGRYLFAKRGEPEFLQAIARFEDVVRRAPGFAAGHAALAQTLMVYSGYGFRPQSETAVRVRQEANRAIELDPGGADGHRILGLLAENYDYDGKEAERQYKLALEANPNDAETHQFYGE